MPDVIFAVYPGELQLDGAIPVRARSYLEQALNSKASPSGAIMLCASSVDAMLKEMKYTKGSLYDRIDKAATDHVITTDMAAWAHEVRLDANNERHADEGAPLPTIEDGERAIEFTAALAEILFVLPAKIQKGRLLAKTDNPA